MIPVLRIQRQTDYEFRAQPDLQNEFQARQGYILRCCPKIIITIQNGEWQRRMPDVNQPPVSRNRLKHEEKHMCGGHRRSVRWTLDLIIFPEYKLA